VLDPSPKRDSDPPTEDSRQDEDGKPEEPGVEVKFHRFFEALGHELFESDIYLTLMRWAITFFGLLVWHNVSVFEKRIDGMRKISIWVAAWALALFSAGISTKNGKIQWMTSAEAKGPFTKGGGTPCRGDC
jgi:hypothetical protein